jgi:hypothetical protein
MIFQVPLPIYFPMHYSGGDYISIQSLIIEFIFPLWHSTYSFTCIFSYFRNLHILLTSPGMVLFILKKPKIYGQWVNKCFDSTEIDYNFWYISLFMYLKHLFMKTKWTSGHFISHYYMEKHSVTNNWLMNKKDIIWLFSNWEFTEFYRIYFILNHISFEWEHELSRGKEILAGRSSMNIKISAVFRSL